MNSLFYTKMFSEESWPDWEISTPWQNWKREEGETPWNYESGVKPLDLVVLARETPETSKESSVEERKRNREDASVEEIPREAWLVESEDDILPEGFPGARLRPRKVPKVEEKIEKTWPDAFRCAAKHITRRRNDRQAPYVEQIVEIITRSRWARKLQTRRAYNNYEMMQVGLEIEGILPNLSSREVTWRTRRDRATRHTKAVLTAARERGLIWDVQEYQNLPAEP